MEKIVNLIIFKLNYNMKGLINRLRVEYFLFLNYVVFINYKYSFHIINKLICL